MKYIRTKEDFATPWCNEQRHYIYKVEEMDNSISFVRPGVSITFSKDSKDSKNLDAFLNNITMQADTIEELCDRFVIEYKQHNEQRILKTYIKVERNFLRDKMYKLNHIQNLYGAIWTDKGLIYVAKMNDKGELELL